MNGIIVGSAVYSQLVVTSSSNEFGNRACLLGKIKYLSFVDTLYSFLNS